MSSRRAGMRLGPYEVVCMLGAGGMGEVYRARDTRLGRDVAVKVLPPALSADAERLQRFELEARAAAALNHSNILAVYDIGRHEAEPYIVSELLEGESLRDRLRNGPLPVRKAVDYAVQIARGLAAAHDKGIVHRDLKPENLFVTADGRVKILDFGLAKLTQAEAGFAAVSDVQTTPPSTNPGVVLGTVGYMSPEQVRGVAADQRADIFAFGAVLYEMLSGRRAFQGDTAMDSMTAILTNDPPDLPVAERHIPLALERIVNRCIEKVPSARFQTAADLAFALDAISLQSGGTDTVTGVPVAKGRSRLGWATAAVVSVVMLAALGLGTLVYFRRAPNDTRVYRSTYVPPANLGGPVWGRLALSPDGRRLAFVAPGPDGHAVLWVRPLDVLAAQALDGTDDASNPFWSPDSRSLAFTTGGKLKRIDASGGPAVTICDCELGSPGAWSRDDVIVFNPGGLSPLVRVPAAGGTPSPVTTLDSKAGETVHGLPFFLPDGRHFLYTGGDLGQSSNIHVYVGSLDSTERRRLLTGFATNAQYALGHLLFLRGSTLMAQAFDPARLTLTGEAVPVGEQVQTQAPGVGLGGYSVSATGVLAFQQAGGPLGELQLAWFDRAGKQLGVLGERAGFTGEVSLSPDGSHAAVAVSEQGAPADIWTFDVARGVRTRLTFGPAPHRAPIWSPDGSRIAFSAVSTTLVPDLHQKAASGAGTENLLLADAFSKFPGSWSSDGRFLLYDVLGSTTPPNSDDVWAFPLEGDRKPFPFLQSVFSEQRAQFSPDGRWVAYGSNESGRFEVYVAPFPGPGGKWQVSTTGGNDPRWNPDGKEIFYLRDNKMMAAAVKADGTRFEVGAVQPLFDVRPPSDVRGVYDVTRDGRFLVTMVEQQGSIAPITLVVNWPAALRK